MSPVFALASKKGLITFHFSENMFSFSKWVSEWAFIFKMWFSFKMCFHFQNMKGFVIFVFTFSKKHNCKQKSVHSLQIALLIRLWTNNKIYIKLLNFFLLSRIYNLLYLYSFVPIYIYSVLWNTSKRVQWPLMKKTIPLNL